jgi:hypothetical protein
MPTPKQFENNGRGSRGVRLDAQDVARKRLGEVAPEYFLRSGHGLPNNQYNRTGSS